MAYLSGKDLNIMLSGGEDGLDESAANVTSAPGNCDSNHDYRNR